MTHIPVNIVENRNDKQFHTTVANLFPMTGKGEGLGFNLIMKEGLCIQGSLACFYPSKFDSESIPDVAYIEVRIVEQNGEKTFSTQVATLYPMTGNAKGKGFNLVIKPNIAIVGKAVCFFPKDKQD